MIGFRVDANSEIGTGHLMRCLAIADRIKEKGVEVCFFTVDGGNKNFIDEKGFRCYVLDGVYTNIEKDFSQLREKIVSLGIKVLLVDSYFVTKNYLKQLCEIVKVAYIDDLHEMIYPCNLLIDYAIFADLVDYETLYKETNTRLLLGSEYIPLRREFAGIVSKAIKDRVENILVLSGGTDQYHFLLQFAEQIVCANEFPDVTFQLVCGKYNTDKTILMEMQKNQNNLEVFENLADLKDYMINADVAISAGGTTLYELAACGTPTIGYALADNQIENLQIFADRGYVISIGDIRKGFSKNEIINALKKISKASYRTIVRRKMQKLVDGIGTERLAKEIIDLI